VSAVLFVGSSAFFVWWQFFREGGERDEVGRAAPEGPRMAIPKGRRVRPGN
jgi:hypothetical protein